MADLVNLFRQLARRGPGNNTAIAAKAGLSRSYVGEMLNGRKVPSPSTAAAFAGAMGANALEVTAARRLAEQVQRLHRHERVQAAATASEPRADLELRDICVSFALALDDAHHRLRECSRSRHEDLAQAANQAVHDSGIYAHRERLLICASPALALAAETVFLTLVDIRAAVRQGAAVDTADYRNAYRLFADAMWAFRSAARVELSLAALDTRMLLN